MNPDGILTGNFLSRKMLAFEHGTKFHLRLKIQARAANLISVRGITREGVFTFTQTTNTDGTLVTTDFAIPDFPIMVSVVDSGDLFRQGECYASLSLLVNGDPLYSLCSGLIYAIKGISYPVSPAIDQRVGGGRIYSPTVANPAAGAEISVTVPGNCFWKVLTMRAPLVTDATVANRRVHVRYTRDGIPFPIMIDTFSDVDQTASLTRTYNFGHFSDQTTRTDGGAIQIALPDQFLLKSATTLTTVTTGLVAGDNWGDVVLWVEEFFTSRD